MNITRSAIIELLRDKKLTTRQIAKIVDRSVQRVCQIYKEEKELSNLPVRLPGGNHKKGQKTFYMLKCNNCSRIFYADLKRRKCCSKDCSYKCRSAKVEWPKKIVVTTTLKDIAKELGISYTCLRKKLVNFYGWDESMFRAVDGRIKR